MMPGKTLSKIGSGVLIIFLLLVLLAVTAEGVSVTDLRCEYLVNPQGIDVVKPRLSWVLCSKTRGQSQTGYQILVASGKKSLTKNKADLWDSGKVLSGQSIQIEYKGTKLQSGQDCYWKVRVWNKNGKASGWSRAAFWTMGLLKAEEWKAKWIQSTKSPCESAEPAKQIKSLYPLPIFRKEFEVGKRIRGAKVFVSGMGHYELFLNGRKVETRFLEPAWSVYEKTVYYNTYDITDALQKGTNAFGVMLGKGFYSNRGDRRIHGVNVYRPLKLILQAHIVYEDGSGQTILSDSTWKVTEGPITHCAILGGSDYDARLLPKSWNLPDFDDSNWHNALETTGPAGRLSAYMAPFMKTLQRFKPVKVDEPEPGYFVYNFGQNASAIPCIVVQGKAGQKIRLTPAEQRHGQSGVTNDGTGRVNSAGVGKPNYWEYTLRGGRREMWSPQFTYSGYQYIEVSGAVPKGRPNPQKLPVVKELNSLQVRNASPKAGTFSCSKKLFNDTQRLIDWAVQSNMAHVLTDCPHREKLGWLEVSYLMGPSIAYNYDIAAFYAKKIRDISDSQDENGKIYTVAPNYPKFKGGFRYSPEWAAAGVFLPWQLYQWYGDQRVLENNYTMMKKYVDFMHQTSKDLIAMPGLGDWYDYGHKQSLGASRFTPAALTATATFYGCADIISKTAKLLGKSQDADKYSKLCLSINQKFNQQFWDGKSVYQNNGSPQTANSIALALGLVKPGNEQPVLEKIIADLEQRDYQQTAGDVGYHYLVEVLDEYDRSDVLYRILNRFDVGSYGYIIQQGWTSMPEAWDASLRSSMNHCMLGHIQQWFFEGLGGIISDSPGFKRIIIKPEIVGDLTWVKASYNSIHGLIATHWIRKGKKLKLNVEIPPNTTATVYVPAKDVHSVKLKGRPALDSKSVRLVKVAGDRVVLEIVSGKYKFSALMAGK